MKKIKKNNLIIQLITGFLDFISISLFFILSEFKFRKKLSAGLIVSSTIVRIVMQAILSFILINSQKSFKHHYLSMIIMGMILIIFLIISFLIEKEKNDNFFLKFITSIIPDVGFSLMYTLGLKFLIGSSGNIYKLLFSNGIIGIIFSIIIQFILFFCNYPKDYNGINYQICDENGKFKTIIFNLKNFENFGGINTIFIIIFNFFENICIFFVIFHFSINHFSAIFSIPTYFQFIIGDWNLDLKILYLIGGFIMIFMTLVYNEIIILRFFGLEKNTKIEIKKRAKFDYEIKEILEDKLIPSYEE